MTKNSTVDQALRQQVKEEIGEDENITFKQKNMLNQKFGIQPAFITPEELAGWEAYVNVRD